MDLHFEAQLQCPGCSYRFRARVTVAQAPSPNERYEVYCPSIGSLLFFPASQLQQVPSSDSSLPQAFVEGNRYQSFRQQRDALFRNEEAWLASQDPDAMLRFLWERVSVRKLRLFACACCRRAAGAMVDERSRNAVLFAEILADTEVDAQVVQSVAHEAFAPWNEDRPVHHLMAAAAAWACLAAHEWKAAWEANASPTQAASDVAEAVRSALAGEGGRTEGTAQADLLRHMVGNPFRPYVSSACWPLAVVQLAQALYTGADCAFALHDALLEAGHPELAEHFRQETEHPKGCWVLDLILARC